MQIPNHLKKIQQRSNSIPRYSPTISCLLTCQCSQTSFLKPSRQSCPLVFMPRKCPPPPNILASSECLIASSGFQFLAVSHFLLQGAASHCSTPVSALAFRNARGRVSTGSESPLSVQGPAGISTREGPPIAFFLTVLIPQLGALSICPTSLHAPLELGPLLGGWQMRETQGQGATVACGYWDSSKCAWRLGWLGQAGLGTPFLLFVIHWMLAGPQAWERINSTKMVKGKVIPPPSNP